MDNRRLAAGLDDMVVFAAVADSLGFSAAARRLGVSKTMVSAAVARLERRLGVKLFHRTTRRLSLTESGSAALPHAMAAWSALQEAEDAATSLRAAPRGTLRINAPMSFGIVHLAPKIHAFCEAFPEVQVDLVLDDRVVDLIGGAFDVAIRIGQLQDSSLSASLIGRNRNVVVASPAYLATAAPIRRPADLSEHPCVLYSLSSTGDQWDFTKGDTVERVPVAGRVRVNSSLAMLNMVRCGAGVARMPLFAAAEALRQREVVALLPEWEIPSHGIYAMTTARVHQPRKTGAFIDFLRAQFGDTPYWEHVLRD
ncbi:MAG TPA: LysR family transcriptional regulator [Lysobacter sp.]|nr:LysR family transcriptional regulator [Lysobacter sp.]